MEFGPSSCWSSASSDLLDGMLACMSSDFGGYRSPGLRRLWCCVSLLCPVKEPVGYVYIYIDIYIYIYIFFCCFYFFYVPISPCRGRRSFPHDPGHLCRAIYIYIMNPWLHWKCMFSTISKAMEGLLNEQNPACIACIHDGNFAKNAFHLGGVHMAHGVCVRQLCCSALLCDWRLKYVITGLSSNMLLRET